MSEIPFVDRLGDAIEAATQSSDRLARARRRRPGRLIVVLAVLLTLGGSVAIAAILSSPTKLAVSGVSCYEHADLSGATTGDWPGDRSPGETCAQHLRAAGQPVPSLATCDNGRGAVVVFPGSGPDACQRAGLRPLPAQYSTEQARVSALERALISLEYSADCIAPREFAARVQVLLRESGWTGWRPSLRTDIRSGPCGSVSGLGGNGVRTIGGALDADARRVVVATGPHRSTDDLLHSRDRGIAGPLMDASGERCYTQSEVRELARRRLASSGRSVAFTVSQPPAGVGLGGPRSQRLAAGCAIVVDLSPAADGLGVVVGLWQRG